MYSGVPDVIGQGRRGEVYAGKPYVIGEGKGSGVGEWQLLGAMIKAWAMNGVYPIGKCVLKHVKKNYEGEKIMLLLWTS